MDDGFELLEEKVHKAADTVKRLREEKQTLERERNQLQHRLEETEKSAGGKAGPSPADARRIESLTQELKQMQQEREQIKKRIGSLLEVLEGLESL
jgi:FtsZ-binding cell division protein ZapB